MGNYYWRMVTDTVGHEEVKDYTVEDVLVGVIKYQVDEGLLRMFCEVCLVDIVHRNQTRYLFEGE